MPKTSTVILTIEDNPADEQLVKRLFARLGARVELHAVSDGEQALRYLFRSCEYVDPADSPRPDLILLDINLPRVRGPQVLQRIKSQPELAEIPVVVVSSSTSQKDIERCRRYGCDGIVTKSIDLDAYREVLIAAVRKRLPALASDW